jgi:hypothetical protein
MRYRCDACGASQWRGFFPEPTFHLRDAVFHGVALGIAGSITMALFSRLGYSPRGWPGGPAALAVCAVILLLIYVIAIVAEACYVATRRCSECGARALHVD